MSTGIERVKDDFEKTMDNLLSRAASFQGGAARIYKLYQKFQTERFKTENQSEKGNWDPLEPKYKDYKLKRYGGGPKRDGGNWKTWPGSGTKMMIGTGTLAGAVIGPGAPFSSEGISAHRALFTKSMMRISVDTSGLNAEGKPFKYAEHANELRNVMDFSEEHLKQMQDELSNYILKG